MKGLSAATYKFLVQKLNLQTKLLPTYCKVVSAVLPLEPQIRTVGGLSHEEERCW